MGNIGKTISEHVAKASFGDLRPEDVEWAKRRVADSLGVLLAGARGYKNDEASVAGLGTKVPAHNAAFANSLLLRSFDFEAVDASLPDGATAPAHITGSTVPVMLALGEATGASGEELLCALVLGDDLAARLIDAGGFGLYGRFDCNGTANCMGATAVAAKLLGLDAERTLGAFGIALNMCGGSMQNVFEAAWTFKLPIALSARNAAAAAEMAGAGLSGVSDPFGGPRCYLETFGNGGGDPGALTAGLGDGGILEKFRRNASFSGIVDQPRAERAFELALRLDELESIQPILGLLAV